MINQLRKNFKLTDVLVRIAFVLAFLFANWQAAFASSVIVLGKANLWVGLLAGLLTGVIYALLLPVVLNFLLNMLKIYSVPRAEYCLIAQAYFALGYFICGVLNCVNFFTPVMLVWGSALFPFVSSLIAALLFYKTTSKLYFNDVTQVYYFKCFAITYLAVLVLVEVL